MISWGMMTPSKQFQSAAPPVFMKAPLVRAYATNGGPASFDAGIPVFMIAAYIHDQINGTFDDIFGKLNEVVDDLEYANKGSITVVTFSCAQVMIEEVGACPKDLPRFLAENEAVDKTLALFDHSHQGTVVVDESAPLDEEVTSALLDELLRCDTERDFIRFAKKQGATAYQGKHWVVKHPCGTRSTMSLNPNPNKTKATRMKILKEFRRIYKL